MSRAEPKYYGKFQIGVPHLRVDRIFGGRLSFGPDGKPEAVQIQFDARGARHCLDLPFLDAMFLWSMLRAIQLDTEFPMPDDPRLEGPSGKTN